MNFFKRNWLNLLVIVLAFLNVGQQWLYGSHRYAYIWLAIAIIWVVLTFIIKDDGPKK